MRENLPTIEQMECFIIYGRTGNFARAAREANITQSAFSAQIKHLECVLGVKLIERSPRGSHLTEEGERFLPRIRKWMEGLREIVDDTRLAVEEPAELNVGILRSLGDIQMNRHVARFRELHPNLQLNVFDMPTYQIHQAMTEGRLDVVSTYFVEKSLPDGASLEDYAIVRFCRDNMVYYGPRMDMGDQPLTKEEILGRPLVLYPSSYYMNRIYTDYFMDTPMKYRISARLSSPYAIIHYCQENEAGALLPDRLLKTLGHREGIYPLEVPLVAEGYLIYRKDHPAARLIQDYVNQILASFQSSTIKEK